MTALRTRIAAAALAALLLAPAAGRAQAARLDILITGGTVVDGTGSPGRRADVGIRGDRIAFVGDAAAHHITAQRTIDARGLIVAPGFIDPHTHTEGDLNSDQGKANLPYLMQGVTTVVTGNDGGGPVHPGRDYTRWEQQGIGTNAALFVGQGEVRRAVLGMSDATPTPAQLDSMKALVDAAMHEGAIGMSTGLYYAPGSYASTEEVIELATVAARDGGTYESHLRDESSYTVGLLAAVREALRISREAHIPVMIAHIKALGTDVWGYSDSVIALVDSARAEGLPITASQYPYNASGTSVGASLLPRWAEVGGRDSLYARIADAATRARLVPEMEANLRRRGGPESLLITSTRDSTILGKTLGQVAAARHEAPIDAALQIIRAGDAGVASFNMSEQDIENFMRQPWVVTGSDGSAGHPRKYGTFPRKLREYVERRHVLTLPEMVHRSSALTADALRLADRGELKPGDYADVIAFDPKTVADRSTYREPRELAIGMRWVLVNGTVTIDDGRYTGALAGRTLRHAVASSTSDGR